MENNQSSSPCPICAEIIKRRGSLEPNAETIEALDESRSGTLKGYKTLDEFWEAMGIKLYV